VNLLWVVTKPPWPPVDGGRLVVVHTLAALRARGHQIDLVAPHRPDDGDAGTIVQGLTPLCRPHLVPVAPRPLGVAALAALRARLPLSIARHRHAALGAVVAELLRTQRFDVVHAEQLQALTACEPAFAAHVPVVLRCQNVESDLWRDSARGLAGALARREATRLARFEGRALRRVAAAVALTEPDAARLALLAGAGAAIVHVAAPFPAELPPGAPLGAAPPALAVLASSGWRPNRDGVAWLVETAWPLIRTASPAASLHLFGARDLPERLAATHGLVRHGAPVDSRDAFPADAVCVVPLRSGSGVRMRILEAWARGVPVVATPPAAHGLDARSGHELLVAGSPVELAEAIRLLDRDAGMRSSLVAAGRTRLRLAHDPDHVATQLEQVYRDAALSGGSGASAAR
jgi:glycosyltransferase involved in cell wall biosynthesis